MTSSRSEILRSIRQQLVEATEHPGVEGDWIQYEDPVGQFRTVLESVGGHLELVSTLAEVDAGIRGLDEFKRSKRVVSAIDSVGPSVSELKAVTDPHSLEDVGFAILPGHFGVAENGAIWMDDRCLIQRAACFIAQHLAFVIPSGAIINTMHDAYQRIRPQEQNFGVFVSGPSKTADIEQSLVIGAHGARSLSVFIVDELRDTDWPSNAAAD